MPRNKLYSEGSKRITIILGGDDLKRLNELSLGKTQTDTIKQALRILEKAKARKEQNKKETL